MVYVENFFYLYDVLIIFDDLIKYVNIFREIVLLIDKLVGKEVMLGDMFFVYFFLLERSGSFVNRKIIIVLFIIKIVDGDIISLIVLNVILIIDG